MNSKEMLSLFLIMLTTSCTGIKESPTATWTVEANTPIPTNTPPTPPATITPTSSPTSSPAPTFTNTPTATATPDTTSIYYVECWATAMTQTEMNWCSGETYMNSYRILQELVVELRSYMDDEEWNLFIDMQAQWEIFKEADCRLQRVLMQPGTIAPMIHGLCLHERHYQRIQELKIILCGVLGPPDCEAALKYPE